MGSNSEISSWSEIEPGPLCVGSRVLAIGPPGSPQLSCCWFCFYLPPALLRCNWHTTLWMFKVYNIWFDGFIYGKMIATIVLQLCISNNSILLHNYYFFFVVRLLNIYSLCSVQIYDTVLPIITVLPVIIMLRVRCQELVNLIILDVTHLIYPFIC